MVDNLVGATNDTILFSIQGGEPTLWPHLTEFISYIKSKKGLVQLFSNGSRTIRWWEEFLSKTRPDRLIISHHTEQNAKTEHTEKVMKLAKEKYIDRCVNVTIINDPLLFEKTISHATYLRDKLPGAVITLSPIMIKNTDFLQEYSTEQLSTIKTFNEKNKFSDFSTLLFSIELLQGNQRRRSSSQILIFNNKNKFNGWDCDAGSCRLIIETDEAYAGICRVGGVIGKVSERNINWLSSPIKCNLEYCNCGSDIIIPKRKPL
jgi:organic radical activating enzyme